MRETDPHEEGVGGIKPQDSRELIGQLSRTYHSREADEVVELVGYDSDKVKQRLQELTDKGSDRYKFFVSSLRRSIKENEVQVTKSFDGFFTKNPETVDSQERRKELETRVFRRGEAAPALAQEIKGLFPRGNYLVHGTSVEGTLSIAEDRAIRSVSEIRKNNEEFRGNGGYLGVSFSYNSVRALPGTWRHMTMFVTSPESAMSADEKLVVPYYAADRELQLVGKSYDRDLATYVESTLDFYGLKSLLGGGGVISDFAELEKPFGYIAGETPIEKDLQRLKSGEIKQEDIERKYKVVNGKLTVAPDVMEQDISPGLVYSDYLLKHTPEGRELGKSVEECAPQELLDLYNKTIYRGREIIAEVERASGILSESMATSVDIEDTVMFTPESDVDRWLDVFSRTDKAPRAFITFSPQEGPRVPNWKLPEGEWSKAEQIVNKALYTVGVQESDLPFSKIAKKEITEGDIIGHRIRHLNWCAIKDAQEIVVEDGQLKIQDPT
ncbi:hypothetical protein C4564_05755 [Candidatus Microgenomates bacterium]|nr:MAG: hypothetical protein C4564_05755 [Candidatus Microgenomates bacterium]